MIVQDRAGKVSRLRQGVDMEKDLSGPQSPIISGTECDLEVTRLLGGAGQQPGRVIDFGDRQVVRQIGATEAGTGSDGRTAGGSDGGAERSSHLALVGVDAKV